MKPEQITGKQIAVISIVCGIIGGAALITSTKLSHNGFWSIAVWTVAMLITFIVALTRNNTELLFKKWMLTGTLTFSIMSYIMYFYLNLFDPNVITISFLGHLWRLAAMFGFGLISSAVLGLFLLKRKPATLRVS